MYPKEYTNNKWKKLRFFLIVAVIIGAILYGYIYFQNNWGNKSQRGAADTFIKLTLNNDPKSYTYLSETLRKQVGSEQEWMRSIKDRSQEGTTFSRKSINPVINPDLSYPKDSDPNIYTYSVITNSTTFKLRLVVMLENGLWRVDEIVSSTI